MQYVEDEDGHVRIGGFTPELTEKKPKKDGKRWYAIDLASQAH
jgi:hypothetical protein